MALKTKIKVGNITNLSDARYCAGMGVDMLGFKVSEVAGQGISASAFKEITDWISGPEVILESSGADIDLALEKVNGVEFDASELFNLKSLSAQRYAIIRLDAQDWILYQKDLLENAGRIKYLLVTNRGASDVKHVIDEMSTEFEVLLGFPIQTNMLDHYLGWPSAGLALSGSEETSPGIKDYDHLSSILENLEVE